ncbi:MAG TPA: M90 family metallopeptidase [Gemmatimonadaceae bacterium]
MVFGITNRRRAKLRAEPVPAAWLAIVQRNVGIFQRLPPADRAELLGHVRVFLAEKHFEGAGGLELTDEIRVTIAAQACLLLLHRETDYYPNLTSIIVYPTAYVAERTAPIGGGIWEEGEQGRFGETGQNLGALVLAWDEAKRGAQIPSDGANVVLHEFAHQLDFEDGVTDGTPALATRDAYAAWARVMSAEFEALRKADDSGAPTLLDKYGATNHAEFFAVITEAFFERPRALRARHPELYTELQQFYEQDPVQYSSEG